MKVEEELVRMLLEVCRLGIIYKFFRIDAFH
jgi:hypothetical protein